MTMFDTPDNHKEMILEAMAGKMPRTEKEIFLNGSSIAALNEQTDDLDSRMKNIMNATRGLKSVERDVFCQGYQIYQELD